MTHLRPFLALRLGTRGLLRDPATTLLGTVILALGLALPATFASIVVGAVRPLPVPDGASVIRVDVVQPLEGGRSVPVLAGEVESLRGAAGLAGLGGFRAAATTLSDPEAGTFRLPMAEVEPSVLPLLEVQPERGRWPQAPGELLLAAEMVERMGAEPSGMMGRTVRLDGVPHTVVGIMPRGFQFPFRELAWAFLPPGAEGPVELVGRLSRDGAPAVAEAALGTRWAAGDGTRTVDRSGGRVQVQGFTRGRGEGGEAVAFLGLVLVGVCLLLIACSNVANLLLARAARRVRALGIQSALGAGRGQVALQLVTEAALIAACGGLAGLVLAWGAISSLERALAGEHFGYFWMRMGIDGTVLAFVGVLVLGTALIAGLLPVVRVLGMDVQQVLREEGTGGLEGGGAWARRFVSAQLALSCGALVAGGLAAGSVWSSLDVGASLPVDNVAVARVPLDADPSSGAPLVATLEARPEVAFVAVARGLPGYREGYGRLEVEGGEPVPEDDRPVAVWNDVTPSYFELLGIGLREGRLLSGADIGEDAGVVSASFAREWLDDRPLGRRVRVHTTDGEPGWVRVVGVVDDVELLEADLRQRARLYRAAGPESVAGGHLLVRTRGAAEGHLPLVRRVAAQVDPELAFDELRTLSGMYEYLVRASRTLALLALAGGLAGLLVAAVGLYGVLSFRVREQRRAIGVRRALGADGMRVGGEVLGWALWQLLPAVAVGLTLAWIASPVLAALLLGSDPRRPVVYLAVGLGFVATGLAAALMPAIRAASVDPARVLRGE